MLTSSEGEFWRRAKTRFVAGKILEYAPVLTPVAITGYFMHTILGFVLLGQMLLIAGLIYRYACKRWRNEKQVIRVFAAYGGLDRNFDVGTIRQTVLYVGVAGLAVGGATAAIRQNFGWLTAGAMISILLLMGVALKHIVYRRWLIKQMESGMVPVRYDVFK